MEVGLHLILLIDWILQSYKVILDNIIKYNKIIDNLILVNKLKLNYEIIKIQFQNLLIFNFLYIN